MGSTSRLGPADASSDSAEQVASVTREGYRPGNRVEGSDELPEVLNLIAAGTFSHGDREVFRPLVENLRPSDPFLVLADYADYVAYPERVDEAWKDRGRWTRMSILNTARGGKFSSDRSIVEYCDRIWETRPVRITSG